MLNGELKNKIDRLWETFWTGGITNPLDVVEQMTYLMFIHDLDATDNQRAKESAMLGLPHKSIFSGEVQVWRFWTGGIRRCRPGHRHRGAAPPGRKFRP